MQSDITGQVFDREWAAPTPKNMNYTDILKEYAGKDIPDFDLIMVRFEELRKAFSDKNIIE